MSGLEWLHGCLGSLETQQLELLGFLRWMHAVVREHVEHRASLNPWKSESSYAPMTLKDLYDFDGVRGNANVP